VYPTFVDGATGTQGIETDTGLTYNPSTGVITATQFTGAVSGNATTATALATGRTIGMTGDVVWTTPSFDGSGNVTAAGTIQTNAVQAAMVHEDVISGRTELTSGNVATSADFLLLWDATDSVFKKVKPSNLGVSGLASGSANELQYNNSNAFAGASNVEIKNSSLALKEQATPNATTGYGMIYAKTDNELYYRNDTDAEVQLTLAGAMGGGGAFRGIKAYLTANNTIGTGSATTPTAWTESYDVGAIHDGSTNTDRFTFGVVGYYEIKVQQEWAADAAGYREMRVTHIDTSNSNAANVILRDRMDGSSQATISGSSTMFYADDASDYLTVQLYQNSGADLVATGNNDDSTAITISRIDMATGIAQSNGASGRVQLSDGSGNFTSDSDLTFSGSTLTATNIAGTLTTAAQTAITSVSSSFASTITSAVASSYLQLNDNAQLRLGTGADSTLYYDGTDTFLNLRAVGTGDLMIALAGSYPSPDAGSVHVWTPAMLVYYLLMSVVLTLTPTSLDLETLI